MGGCGMRIAVLTSSRADYGIYLPLLKKLKKDSFFELKIIVFGTHLSEKFGNTIEQIRADGFEPAYQIETLPKGDSPEMISRAMGETVSKFSALWEKEKSNIDLILCLGDRYEMFAAVSASVPFNIPVAHLHGGETTTGAIDDAFRHSITSMASVHFTSTEKHAKRVVEIKGSDIGVHNVGALSLDNVNEMKILSTKEFKEKYNVDLDRPVLVTFHPETINYERNKVYAKELTEALKKVEGQILITMPNADTMGNVVRNELLCFAKENKNVVTVESLGTQGYFSAIHHCLCMIGNSSSGIIEAASFGKYVVNLGKRQEGRDRGKNVIDCEINKNEIISSINKIKTFPVLDKTNIYGDGKSADRIITILKKSGK